MEERLSELLTGVELVSYERLEPEGDHVLMLFDHERGVGLVIHLPQAWIDDYERGQRQRLERLFRFAGREMKTLAAEQLNAV
ncbi:MAG: hypothetical protein L0212_08805 [Acidobacteria bacterium]|nr:hypothetical protein [Acidobacteriota bacterium]